MQVNKMACIERFSDIAVAFGERPGLDHHSAANRVIERLHALCRDVNIPANLRALNIPEQDLPSLAEEALGVERLLRNNPRTLSLQDILGIYQAAF
jgi:alcohol dehydrogenase class IV